MFIPNYFTILSKKKYPDDFINGARVTHIWTQNERLSNEIARASKIKIVVHNPSLMIGEIDALLLARDDAENHIKLALPFIKAGIPIFIDKPLALHTKDLSNIISLQKFDSQIFSCSALRYAKELKISKQELLQLGFLKKIIGKSPKSWAKYGIHIIEPIIAQQFANEKLEKIYHIKKGNYNEIGFRTSNNLELSFITTGETIDPISLEFVGDQGAIKKIFSDSFSAFKKALESFLIQIREKKKIIPQGEVEKIISIVEQGL